LQFALFARSFTTMGGTLTATEQDGIFLTTTDAGPIYFAPINPWENGYIEAFNSRLRDELLNRELFLRFDELRTVANRRRMDYNRYRPHNSLNDMSTAGICNEVFKEGFATLSLP